MNNAYEIVKEIRTYAKENNVPIMLDDGIEFLTNYIVENKINASYEVHLASLEQHTGEESVVKKFIPLN